MKNKYFKSHPMTIKGLQNKDNWYVYSKFQQEIWSIFDSLPKDIHILEIGFWRGDFSNFCKQKNFINYTGIDIDDTFLEDCKTKYELYDFLEADIVDFLSKRKTYDVIFMSHVFEHLDEEKASETVALIFNNLNKWGYWVNYMPNADSTKACALKYIDITHKSIYNTHSLEQILLMNWANFIEIKHFNTLPSIHPFIKAIFKVVHPFFLLPTKVYFYGMWNFFPRIYTSEMLSIMKK